MYVNPSLEEFDEGNEDYETTPERYVSSSEEKFEELQFHQTLKSERSKSNLLDEFDGPPPWTRDLSDSDLDPETFYIPLIRCYACGKVIGALDTSLRELIKKGMKPFDAFTKLGIKRICCMTYIWNPPQLPMGAYFYKVPDYVRSRPQIDSKTGLPLVKRVYSTDLNHIMDRVIGGLIPKKAIREEKDDPFQVGVIRPLKIITPKKFEHETESLSPILTPKEFVPEITLRRSVRRPAPKSLSIVHPTAPKRTFLLPKTIRRVTVQPSQSSTIEIVEPSSEVLEPQFVPTKRIVRLRKID